MHSVKFIYIVHPSLTKTKVIYMLYVLKDLDQLIEQNIIDYKLAWLAVCDYRGDCSATVEALQNMVEARFEALNASEQAHYKTYLSLPK